MLSTSAETEDGRVSQSVLQDRTMESILRELREMLAKEPSDERDRPRRPMPLSEEIQRIIRE